MGYADEQRLVNMENTIMRWKREVDKVRVCLVGSVLVSLLLTLLFSEKSDRQIYPWVRATRNLCSAPQHEYNILYNRIV